MRVGIDAMGGDRAPAEVVRGALAACDLLDDDDRLVLVGRENEVRPHLDGADGPADRIELHHAPDVIDMDAPPVEALRAQPDSSIAVLAEMHKAGAIDAFVSAGNTGACVAAAQMRLRRLRGVHRPGIAIIAPTFHGPVCICDVGANVNCRPEHLHQYGQMASLYVQALADVERPRVALLSIGEEDAKGNELVKRTHQLLRDDPSLQFVGNVEGRDLFTGACDVLVCEGFVGNVVLKLMEGMAPGIITALVGELAAALPEQAQAVRDAAGGIRRRYDFNEYGGAPLLGVGGICMICHGASSYRGIKYAVRGAKEFARRRVNDEIIHRLSQS